MDREARKATYQRSVFEGFLKRSGLSVDGDSIRDGDANAKEPDLICSQDGQPIGFELGRLTDPNLKEVTNRWEPINGEYVRTGDPSLKIALSKLQKVYSVSFRVQLLLYREDPIITPDDVIIPTIKPLCSRPHEYSRVWFMGDTVEILFERENSDA